MAHKQSNTNLSTLLFSFMNQPDPMLSMPEWLCEQMMEAEVSLKLNADKSERSDGRYGYRSGYRPRRLDTRLGTVYLMIRKTDRWGSLFTADHQPQYSHGTRHRSGSPTSHTEKRAVHLGLLLIRIHLEERCHLSLYAHILLSKKFNGTVINRFNTGDKL